MTGGQRVTRPTYTCDHCHTLIHGPEGQHGTLCPTCETGTLVNVAIVTERMLERSERAS